MTDTAQFRDLAKAFVGFQSQIEYSEAELASLRKSASEAQTALIEALRNDASVRAIHVDSSRVVLVKRPEDDEIELEMIKCV